MELLRMLLDIRGTLFKLREELKTYGYDKEAAEIQRFEKRCVLMFRRIERHEEPPWD